VSPGAFKWTETKIVVLVRPRPLTGSRGMLHDSSGCGDQTEVNEIGGSNSNGRPGHEKHLTTVRYVPETNPPRDEMRGKSDTLPYGLPTSDYPFLAIETR
jgi:hypothetical protein